MGIWKKRIAPDDMASAWRGDAARNLDAAVRMLGAQAQPRPLAPRRRERVIEAAFADAARRRTTATRGRPVRESWSFVAAMAAALIVGALIGARLAPRTVASRTENAAVDRVISGDVALDDSAAPLETHGSVPIDSRLGALLQLGPATVELSPETSASWTHATSTLRLRAGSAQFVVAPTRERPFRIETDAFVVEVIGTVLQVDTTAVHVLSGRVRVLTPAGDPLVDVLGAGESWTLPKSTAPAAEPEDTEDEDAAPSLPEVVEPPGRPQKVGREDEPPARARARRASSRKLVNRARKHLLLGEVGAARQAAETALSSLAVAEERADAKVILAECAQASGDIGEALRRYLEVADEYPRLQTGQLALFAAARLEARRGSPESSRALLRRYLREYPGGRFESDAAAMLRAEGGGP